MSQPLPAKDQAVFRSIVKFYETKQYKKGLKAADSILKKHPDHGETLCMKGLTVSYLDRKEEAYELVRKGLKCDLKSHVCWHVYGLLYRQDRDYFEAVKCYRQALRIDQENLQILRDLSLLQIHRRDVHGFAETRRKLLQVKSSARLNWVGYAIAEHLCENYELAWKCIDNYENSFKEQDTTAASDYENSELHLYKASIMEEAGLFKESLNCLKENEGKIVDKIGLMEMQGRLCMFLSLYEEAAGYFKRLVDINTEHHVYSLAYMASQPQFSSFWPPLPAPTMPDEHSDLCNGTAASKEALPKSILSFPSTLHPEGMPVFGWLPPKHALKPQRRLVIGRKQHKRRVDTLEPAEPLTEQQEDEVIQFFEGLKDAYPKSDSLKRLPLFFLTGQRFKRKLDEYLRSRLRKGVPSLFRTMRSYYFTPGKPDLIEELLLQYVRCLKDEKVSWFGPLTGEQTEPPEVSDEEPPSALLFTLMTVAEHFDFMGETHKALEYVNEAIAHTPTLVEVYACKARIYKHAGDLVNSAQCYEEVRQMDLADRYLNTQCVRALLRVDDTQGGMEKALLFSKEPDSQEAANLHDMQCMWYESAVGRSYKRQKKYGKALKQFHETFKHFHDIAEDQFDFHNYCLRKTTLKAYVAMLRMQERLYSHRFYRRAAKDAINIYLELFDAKARGDEILTTEGRLPWIVVFSDCFDCCRQDESLCSEAQKEAQKVSEKPSTGKPKKVDDDPDGEKLLQQDAMEQANKIVRNLVQHSSLDAATHVLTYEVFSRQGKVIHCLQALRKLWELAGYDNHHYKLIAPLANFCFKQDLENSSVPAVVREVALAEIAPILTGQDGAEPFSTVSDMRQAASKLVDAVERRIKESKDLFLVEVLYGLKCLRSAGRDCKALLEAWTPPGVLCLKESKKLLDYLAQEFGKDSTAWQRLRQRCLEFFPLMVIPSD
ncbi:NAA15 [Symbiodinium sp. CCMP2456]|nr:NAA15 [Symbiodinium sp. CCMP2456]